MNLEFFPRDFQDILADLQRYWVELGCVVLQPLDLHVGAGTSHPATCLGVLGPRPVRVAYVQPSRRPHDGRRGASPSRLQHHFQFQVLIKPAPDDAQELYLNSLSILGIDLRANDLRFVEDNWHNPTLGAWGLGWEVWLNGVEITQFTYFQQMCGLDCHPVSCELTYGLERLAMHLQDVGSVYELRWAKNQLGCVTYGDLFLRSEVQQCRYNLEFASVDFLVNSFGSYEREVERLLSLEEPLLFPAYELILRSMHDFNLLDARRAFSTVERQNYVARIRRLVRKLATIYLGSSCRPELCGSSGDDGRAA